MNEQTDPGSDPRADRSPAPLQPIVVQQADRPDSGRRWRTRLLLSALLISVLVNFGLYSMYQQYFSDVEGPREKFHSGDKTAKSKLAIIKVKGTIMPPFTERILKSIKKAKQDENVKGVVLVVDSPGGLVADSHQIYHRLQELRQQKPIVVAMQRMAASGGYYVAMGAGTQGKIFAEPTTWTGSIGVIIPRYDVSELAERFGVKSDPLKTGVFKDALSPFRKMSEEERQVWSEILDDAFRGFLTVIAENRPNLEYDAVKSLATGQVYTAEQAKKNGLIDEIGYEDDAVEHLKQQLGLDEVRVVTYAFRPGLVDFLVGTAQARQPENQWQMLLEATVPRALYYCSWMPILTSR